MTGTCAASSAPPAPLEAPSSEIHCARRRCCSEGELSARVQRLARQPTSRLAREVAAFIRNIRRRPLRQPDSDWRAALVATRLEMTVVRNYLAWKLLGVGIYEEEWDALERCVEKLLYEPLYVELYQRAKLGLFMDHTVQEMERLVRRHRRVGVPPDRLGAPEISQVARMKMRERLQHMLSTRLPCDKIDILVRASDSILKSLEEENGIIGNADVLIPLMTWMLVDTGMIYAYVEASLMCELMAPEKERGKPCYYVTTLLAACLSVHTTPEQLKAAVDNVTSDLAAEVDVDSGRNDPLCAEETAAVRVQEDGAVQKGDPSADSLDESSEGYCSDPDRDRFLEAVQPGVADTADHDSCFGDDEQSSQSRESRSRLSSWSSDADLDSLSAGSDSESGCVCSSCSNLIKHSYDESLRTSGCVDNRTAQLYSAGTLFSAVPVFLSRVLMV